MDIDVLKVSTRSGQYISDTVCDIDIDVLQVSTPQTQSLWHGHWCYTGQYISDTVCDMDIDVLQVSTSRKQSVTWTLMFYRSVHLGHSNSVCDMDIDVLQVSTPRTRSLWHGHWCSTGQFISDTVSVTWTLMFYRSVHLGHGLWHGHWCSTGVLSLIPKYA